MLLSSTPEDRLRAWAASGAMSLCGRADGPALGPPAPLVDVLAEAAERIADRTAALGAPVQLDPLSTLTERAAIAGLTRQGAVSCGGASRLLPTATGWSALTLSRADDIDLLPAWLGIEHVGAGDPWPAVTDAVLQRSAEVLARDGTALGLPVAVVGGVPSADGPPVVGALLGPAPPRRLEGLMVVDLSSLWAGPLCGRILCDAGARVVKVESTSRPDGARLGSRDFFDLMNAGKQSVAVDFGTDAGRAALRALVEAADVVVEASRPRALEALGIDAPSVVAEGPSVWLSITAHGRSGDARNRVGFGDDAAAAGGAVLEDDEGLCFCTDALGDPITGMFAAAAVLDALAEGGRWLLDAGMARASAAVAGTQLDATGVEPSDPALPSPRGHAVAMGADTEAVLRELRP